MKTLLISLSFFIGTSIFASELTWVNEQVEAIKPPRTGMGKKEISSIKDPFIFLKKNKPEEEAKKAGTTNSSTSTSTLVKKPIKRFKGFKLTTIINKNALINGKWYKEGDMLGRYKVTEIDSQTVILKKHKKKILLSTHSKNKNLNFNNK